MTTVLGKEGDNLYTAFYEHDTKKRKKELDKWIKKTVPAVQKAVSEELKSLVEYITQDRWTDEGWKLGEAKLRRIQSDYHLVMDIKLRPLTGRELKSYNGELPTSAFKKQGKLQDKQSKFADEDDDYDDGGRTSNDDRSDSMNPNNSAYWSSRGR